MRQASRASECGRDGGSIDEPRDWHATYGALRVFADEKERMDILEQIRKEGFVRVRVNGELMELEAVPALAKTKKHTIEAVVDRLVIDNTVRSRLTDSVELALADGEGLRVLIDKKEGWEERPSERNACLACGVGFDQLEARHFSSIVPMALVRYVMG